MTNHDRLRLIQHGAIILLVGLLCGLPTAVESINETARFWHTAHEGLIMMGIWILTESSLFPSLALRQGEATALVWALLAMGYGFMAALIIGGFNGTTAFAPGGTPVTIAAFLAAVVGILGAVASTGITLMGAHAALRENP